MKLADKFKSINWYRQGGIIVPFFECPAMKSMAGILGDDGYVGIYRGERNHGYFNTDKLLKLAQDHIARQLQNFNHIDELYRHWKHVAEKLLIAIEEDAPIDVTRPLIEEFWNRSWVIEYYDPHGDAIVAQYLKVPDKEREILLSPRQMSRVQIEELDLLHLCLQPNPDVSAHKKRYAHIKASWADATAYSLRQIKEYMNFIKTRSDAQIHDEIARVHSYYRDLNQKKESIFPTLTKTEQHIVHFFELLSEWRDERKECVQKTNCYLQQRLLELEKETGIALFSLKFLNMYDIENDLNKHELAARSRLCIDYMDEKGFWNVCSADVKDTIDIVERSFLSEATELSGTCASKGSAKGIAKIVMSYEDFPTFNRGDVLVAASTRPEFVPVMKKASAIVTDEGGITCHAAIVSRELGIPCVIGTQRATSAIASGMNVSVYADDGKVIIHKK